MDLAEKKGAEMEEKSTYFSPLCRQGKYIFRNPKVEFTFFLYLKRLQYVNIDDRKKKMGNTS